MSIIAPKPDSGSHLAVRIKRPAERRSSSRSATRALDVLELFGRVRRALRAMEISRELDMHSSTTNQLLKTMVDSAHLAFDAQAKTYLPSSRLAAFSTWIVESYGADGRLRGLVEEIHAHSGMVATVTTPNDLFMQIVDAVIPNATEGNDALPERGLQVSILGSAIGSAYLSTLDEAEIRRIAYRARVTDDEVDSLLQSASQIRADGYAVGPTATNGDLWSLAMPLPAQGLRVPAVVGLAGPEERVKDSLPELATAMRAAIDKWFKKV
ncbi:MAG: helix-turn-helix domain-containing protein [Sphingomonadaceae bacterium]|nr:helix-turn-helix domain-containing protein [Sphingomonadaceae bacterium]